MKQAFARHAGRLTRFGCVGLVNTATDIALFSALLFLGAPALAANALSFLVANGQSYVLNARVTFRDNAAPAAMSIGGYMKFLAAHLLSLVISTGVIFAFEDKLGAFGAKLLAIAATLLLNYSASALFVFRARHTQESVQ